MDAIFVRGVHNRANIDTDLMDLFQTKGYAADEVSVVRIMEGRPLDSRPRIFETVFEISGIIDSCFRETDVFTRCMVMVDDESKSLYLMFTQTDDAEMPEIMDMAMETIGNA